MSFKLEWENSVNSQFQTIHRANEPFEADALPPVYATVDKGVADFTDTAIEAFTPYFYRVASNRIVKGISEVVASRLVSGGFMGGPSLDLDFAGQAYATMQPSGAMLGKTFGDIITFTRSSGGGRFNAQGQYEWLPANQPRIDYDPVTGEAKGLLIEEQRTNLLRWSDEFSNAAWLKASGVVIAADDVVAPNGSIAQRIDLVGAGHSIQQGVSVLSVGMTYTLSVWVRPKTTPFPLQLAYYDGVNPLNAIQITPEAGKWTRLSYTFTPTVVATSSALIRLIGFGNGNNGDSLYMWGAQLEVGAFPTSLIHTTTAQVTRAADIATVNELSPWYNPEQGTLFVESIPRYSAIDTCVASVDDGTSSSRIQIRIRGTQVQYLVNASGATACNITKAGTQPAVRCDAFALRGGDFAAALLGEVVGADTRAGVVPNVNRLAIFSGASVAGASGHIRSIRYYPRRLSDTELQAMTQ